MSDPKVSGNSSDELGQHEGGADFENVNRSSFPRDVPDIPVELTKVGRDILVQPTRHDGSRPAQIPGEIEAGLREQLAAAVFDDPNMMVPAAQRDRIKRRSTRDNLVWYGVRPDDAMSMWGDRILVKRDTLESAYSCRNCKGTGHTEENCPTCKGTGQETFVVEGESTTHSCRNCEVLGYQFETKYTCGFVPCRSCSGSGWAGGIVIPEVAQSEPIAGIVVSIGPMCVDLTLGDRVLYQKYCGHNFVTPEGVGFTLMHEHEALSLLMRKEQLKKIIEQFK